MNPDNIHPELFWNWFEANSERLTMLNDLDEPTRQQLLDEMQHQIDLLSNQTGDTSAEQIALYEQMQKKVHAKANEYRAMGGDAVTVEPHLSVFDGLKDLEQDGQKTEIDVFSYPSSGAAFDAACDALKKLL